MLLLLKKLYSDEKQSMSCSFTLITSGQKAKYREWNYVYQNAHVHMSKLGVVYVSRDMLKFNSYAVALNLK